MSVCASNAFSDAFSRWDSVFLQHFTARVRRTFSFVQESFLYRF